MLIRLVEVLDVGELEILVLDVLVLDVTCWTWKGLKIAVAIGRFQIVTFQKE